MFGLLFLWQLHSKSYTKNPIPPEAALMCRIAVVLSKTHRSASCRVALKLQSFGIQHPPALMKPPPGVFIVDAAWRDETMALLHVSVSSAQTVEDALCQSINRETAWSGLHFENLVMAY